MRMRICAHERECNDKRQLLLSAAAAAPPPAPLQLIHLAFLPRFVRLYFIPKPSLVVLLSREVTCQVFTSRLCFTTRQLQPVILMKCKHKQSCWANTF